MSRIFQRLYFLIIVVLISCFVVFAGCLGDRTNNSNPQNNMAPLAKLSVESKGGLVAGNPIVLDGRKSSDPDGDSIEYDFKVVLGQNEILHSTDSDNPVYHFIPQSEGSYHATLTVTDEEGCEGHHTIHFAIAKLEISEIFPPADALNVPLNIQQLTWNCNGCSDARFKVYFVASDTTPYLVTDTNGISGKNFSINMLPYNTVCSWRVIAVNNGCVSDTGVIKFRTAEGNSPPIVKIIQLKERYAEGDFVKLDSEVNDADDDEFTYTWKFASVPSEEVEFDTPFDANTSFQADANGIYEVRLLVLDAKGGEGSAEKEVLVEEIMVSNLVPAPNSANQPLNLAMSWVCNAEDASLKIKFGLCSNFSEADMYDLGESKSFKPSGLEYSKVYCAQLLINNNGVEKTLPANHTDWKFTTVGENTQNHSPVANAGADQSVILGAVIIFDASESSDPDGDDLSFFWKVTGPGGNELAFGDPNQEEIWFFGEKEGTYIGTVTVSDGKAQAEDSVEARVATSINQKPIAEIRVAKTEVLVGEDLSLDGSYSYDPEGEVITYRWTLDGEGELHNADSANALFNSSTDGSTIISLIVNDGQLDSNSVSVEIVVIKASEELYLRGFHPNGDFNVPIDGNIIWESNGEAYDVFFSFDGGNNFELVADFQSGTSFALKPLNLQAGKMYFYNVIAYKQDEYLVSDVMSFQTMEEIPALFISITDPDDRSSEVPVNVCLKWVGNGDIYQVFIRKENQEYVEIASIPDTQYCLSGTKMLAGETLYYLKVVAVRGNEKVQEEIKFTTAPMTLVQWKGVDATLTADGILEISNYDTYLSDEGRQALNNGAIPVLEGDITLWNIADALSAPCVIEGSRLVIDLKLVPFLIGCNSFSVNLKKDGERVAWSQFHILDEVDKAIILRKREGTNDLVLAVDMQMRNGEKLFSPCPSGDVPARMAH